MNRQANNRSISHKRKKKRVSASAPLVLSGYGALLIILQQEGQLFSMPKVTGHPFSLVEAGKSLFSEKGKMDKDYEKKNKQICCLPGSC